MGVTTRKRGRLGLRRWQLRALAYVAVAAGLTIFLFYPFGSKTLGVKEALLLLLIWGWAGLEAYASYLKADK
jgi:hypothetical protein